MNTKPEGSFKLILPAGKANPAPPIGPALGQRGLNIMEFCKSFNDLTSKMTGPVPVIITFYKNNYPKGDGLISILGFFVMISVFSSAHTLPKESQIQFSYLLSKLYPISICSSAILISYPLWIPSWKESKLIGVVCQARIVQYTCTLYIVRFDSTLYDVYGTYWN
jgi:hypothetical protein